MQLVSTRSQISIPATGHLGTLSQLLYNSAYSHAKNNKDIKMIKQNYKLG